MMPQIKQKPKVIAAQKNCKRCYGRGYEGVFQNGKPVFCKCLTAYEHRADVPFSRTVVHEETGNGDPSIRQ